jgi:hypothetical protein
MLFIARAVQGVGSACSSVAGKNKLLYQNISNSNDIN